MLTGFRLSYLLLVLPLLLVGQCKANEYLEELVQQATTLHLSEHSEWHNLLHYQQNDVSSAIYSLADSPDFFLARNGKYDPQAELEATLEAFFDSTAETDDTQNPQCAFIARYHWLKDKLQFDRKRLPERECKRFNAWYQAINPASITLIFPAGYVNNPSSMFGHTLLRIDMPNQDERTRLASYAINYAADTQEANGIVFSVLAIVGGYPGTFSIMPYYKKVKEYNDLENRDIWEYQLNLTSEEIRRLLEHAWELGPIHFDYYFFDENCSYQLLTLLDVARPGLNLSRQFPGWVIPSDTVRVVLDEKGMVQKAIYRPSAFTLLQHQLQQLDKNEQKITLGLAMGETPPNHHSLSTLSDNRRALVLEAAYDYLQYQFNTGKWQRDDAARRALDLLRARSAVPIRGRAAEDITQPQIRPDQGHSTARLAVYYGNTNSNNTNSTFTDVYLRPSYHDLMDADGGYQYGAQINFFDFHVRYSENSSSLEEFTLIDIVSLSPRDDFFKPVSWRISTGLVRFELPQQQEVPLMFNVHGGAGLSYHPGDNQLISLMLEGGVLADNKLPDGYAMSIGPSLRWLWSSSDSDWRFQLYSRQITYYNRIDRDEVEHSFQSNLRLSQNLGLRFSHKLIGEPSNTVEETMLGLNWYF